MWTTQLVVNNVITNNNASSCNDNSSCHILYDALTYINSQQQNSNNVTLTMQNSNNNITYETNNNTYQTYQKWNTSLVIQDNDDNITSSYRFKGQGSTQSLVELFGATISNDGAIYYYFQYGAHFIFEDFTLGNGDSTYDRKFILCNNIYVDGSFTFRNMIFDKLYYTDDFIFDYMSNSVGYGHNSILFEDVIIRDHYQSSGGNFVEQRLSGGVSMNNVLWEDNYFGTGVFYTLERRSSTESDDNTGGTVYGDDDMYFTNILIKNSFHANYFVWDSNAYNKGVLRYENITIIDTRFGSRFGFVSTTWSAAITVTYKGFNVNNISVVNCTVGNDLFYFGRYHGNITNVYVQGGDIGTIISIYSEFNVTNIRNITAIDSKGYYFLSTNGAGNSNADQSGLTVTDIYAKNCSYQYGGLTFWGSAANGTIIANVVFDQVSTQAMIYVVGGFDVRCNDTTLSCDWGYPAKYLTIRDVKLIDSQAELGIGVQRAEYFEVYNINIYSTDGLGFNNSYISGVYSMDIHHIGATFVENITFVDTILWESAYTQFGWTEAYVNGIICDNCHTENYWVFFEFYNMGLWHNYVENIYLNGHYLDYDIASLDDSLNITRNTNCTGGPSMFDCAQGIFYFYYDGDIRKTVGEDTSPSRRELLYFYYYYEDYYKENYTMTNCSDYYLDYYYNVILIDNAIYGPVVMIDIEINDCDMIFDDWHIELTTNLINNTAVRVWDSENIDTQWGNANGKDEGYIYYMWYYYYYYTGHDYDRFDYPTSQADYVPAGIFFVYAYNEENLGVVRILNSHFLNNDGFVIISCGKFSYCKIEMDNCVFENNTYYDEQKNQTIYNVVWIDRKAFGNVTIKNSRFIGDYINQKNGVEDSWIIHDNSKSIFDCINCTFTQTNPPTPAPTIPTAQPTTNPSNQPTENPTQVTDIAIFVSITGDFSSSLTAAVAEVCVGMYFFLLLHFVGCWCAKNVFFLLCNCYPY